MIPIIPIARLGREHQGRVILLDLKQWAKCKGQMGRPWGADEGPDTHGTNDPNDLRDCGFTHFAYLSDIEAAEREWMTATYRELTASEEKWLADKYGRSAVTRND